MDLGTHMGGGAVIILVLWILEARMVLRFVPIRDREVRIEIKFLSGDGCEESSPTPAPPN